MAIALKDLLYKVEVLTTSGPMGVEITGITADSRQVKPGFCFVAQNGTQVDGHQYIQKAIELGAVAIVCQTETAIAENIGYARVADSNEALGLMASAFYGNPSAALEVVAITGTNGKTTFVTLMHRLFRAMGYNTGLLSTVENRINDEVIPSTHTTPDAVSLNALLAQMVKAGCTHVFMEASSHAIHQRRISGIKFAGAVFSNLTHDHLDYHGTFENYHHAKKRLFDDLPADAWALTNVDDPHGLSMVEDSMAQLFKYSVDGVSQFQGRILSNSLSGLQMELDQIEVWFNLTGKFNAYNLTAAYAAAVLLGCERREVLVKLSSLPPVAGRFDYFISPNGVTVVIDYAHTPDALQNVLETITSLRTRNETLYVIVGCGGNRDAAKRPEMARIALEYADKAVFTSDNPRNEEPEAILEDMRKGVSPANHRKVKWEVDREKAILNTCKEAQNGDIILIAGKGHENYQEIKGVKHPFDDKVKALKAFGL